MSEAVGRKCPKCEGGGMDEPPEMPVVLAWMLFLTFAYVGLLTFGPGLVAVVSFVEHLRGRMPLWQVYAIHLGAVVWYVWWLPRVRGRLG